MREAQESEFKPVFDTHWVVNRDLDVIQDIAWMSQSYIWTKDELKELKDRRDIVALHVADEATHEIHGFCMHKIGRKTDDAPEFIVYLFVVDPAWQKRGAGEVMRDELWRKALLRGFDQMSIEVPEPLDQHDPILSYLAYLEDLGFESIKERSDDLKKRRVLKMVYSG